MIIKIENGEPVGAPILEQNFKLLHPDVVFPQILDNSIVNPFGYAMYDFTQRPPVGPFETLVEAGPTKDAWGNWRQGWQVVQLTGTDLAEAQAKAQEAFMRDIVNKVQKRLDAFAFTRNYDGILSACTYATSSIAKFKAEGQYCVEARDATWSAMYSAFAEVQAGTRPMPKDYSEVEPVLPTLAWPA